MAGTWRVRHVVAHLCDTALRRLSIHRDQRMPPSGPRGTSERDLTLFINDLNATWIRVAERFSARVLTELYGHASEELVAFIETLDPLAHAVFPVSWAGQFASPQWLDIGREFTEIWHHGSQIREAVGVGPFRDSSWLGDVLRISMHALPHAYRAVQPPREDVSVVVEITGQAPGRWTLRRVGHAWDIDEGASSAPAATIAMTDETAWRLFFNALSPSKAQSSIALDGDLDLARPIFDARAVIV
jgi:Mycothiol maleylpyruvate isomerase N-terminal domain